MATKITEAITINAPDKEVTFDGVDFTENGIITITDASAITIKNCRFYNLTPNITKTMPIHIKGDIPVKLTITGCYFGDRGTADDMVIYNLMELTAQLKDGSSISRNYFTSDSCTHNHINIYGAYEGATIGIMNNYFEPSEGGVRLGMKGEPTCSINIKNNVFNITNPVVVQPYGTSTTSFANCSIYFSNNTYSGLQYFGSHSGNTAFFTDDNKPNIYVDGILDSSYEWPAAT